MFDKLTGKKKKEGDIFTIPQKKYTTETKTINKMSSKSLVELYHDQQKYISIICEKLQMAKNQYDRMTEKIEQLSQKNDVVNSQVSRMANQQQELSIKFDNLQCSLQILSSDSQAQFRKECQFLKGQDDGVGKLKNIADVLVVYRSKYELCKKIQMQNKNIKARYAELEGQLDEAQGKIRDIQKQKTYNSLIPSLMQQIKELKEKNSDKQNKNTDKTEELEHRILQKFKSEYQTATTAREEEQELQQKQNEIDNLNAEIKKLRDKNKDVKGEKEELKEEIQQFENKVNKMERQISRKKEEIEELENKCCQLEKKVKDEESKLQKQRQRRKEAQVFKQNCEKLKKQLEEKASALQQTQDLLKQKQQKISALEQKCEIASQELKNKEQQLEKQKESNTSLENMINCKNNSQLQNMMQMKNKAEKELQQVKKTLDSQKKKFIELESRAKKNQEQIQNLTLSLKRMSEEKSIIQQNVNNCLKISQDQGEKWKNEIDQLKKQNEELKKQIESSNKKLLQNEDEIKNYSYETQKLVKTIQNKDNDLRKAYANNQQLQKDKTAIFQKINEKDEQMKIKSRKYESQLNQERIELQSVNRKLNISESQSEQNKTSLQNYYQQLLAKDKKISQMEVKLRDYKYRIQVLKKEKQELQNTYENKLSTLQPEDPSLRISEQTEESKGQEKQQQILFDEEKELMKNELYSLKQQNLVILSENEELRSAIDDLKTTVNNKERSIKILQEKRDNIMKEMQKMGRNSKIVHQEIIPPSSSTPRSQPTLQTQMQMHEGRQKKIAAKALKGFQIIIKLSHQLYKNFVSIFAQKMQQQQIKTLQKQINAIIKRSNDMKDVFEGYLQ